MISSKNGYLMERNTKFLGVNGDPAEDVVENWYANKLK